MFWVGKSHGKAGGDGEVGSAALINVHLGSEFNARNAAVEVHDSTIENRGLNRSARKDVDSAGDAVYGCCFSHVPLFLL